jgi:adenosylmethionine-8-amino-7-oxononanoate aminotransferase
VQSIHTKFLGPTNTRGSRIRAIASGGAGSVSVSYDHALNSEQNHDEAAKKLAAKLGWHGTTVRGGGLGGKGNVYVFHRESETVAMPPGTSRG